MKVIVERNFYGTFVYRETEKHFRKTEPKRQKNLVLRTDWDEECRMYVGEYAIIDCQKKPFIGN